MKKHRLKAAKRQLLIDAIATAHPAEPTKPAARRARAVSRPEPSTELPPELLDLLLLLPPLLTAATPLTVESTNLLLSHPPLSSLATLLPHLSPLVSTTLQHSAAQLARLANPNTNPSYVHRAIPALPTHITSQQRALVSHSASLSSSRHATANALTRLLAIHAAARTACARALEAKHGGVARSLELRAGAVSVGARRGAAEVGAALWAARAEVYKPEAVAALAAYARHLKDGRARLGENIRSLEGELRAYGVGTEADDEDTGKERTMKEMARVYRDMERQIEEVRTDLERLGRA